MEGQEQSMVKIKKIIEWAKDEGYQFEFHGDEGIEISGFSSLRKYQKDTLTWINLKNSVKLGDEDRIKCAVIQKGGNVFPANYFYTENSKKLFFGILSHFFTSNSQEMAERSGTYIGKDVILGENVKIGCNCVLDGQIKVGDRTVIEHNVVLMNRVTVGSDCIIHSGTVIGQDGFGFSFDENNLPVKVPHFGGVCIGERVEIGANVTVHRGTIDDTVIRDDVKIDSLVIVAHNAIIGSGTLVVGGVAIGGSCTIGDKSYIAPHATIKNKISIGDNSFIGMGVITKKNMEDNIFIGHPDDKPRKNKDYRRFL